jgi:uncharacterized protein YoxC
LVEIDQIIEIITTMGTVAGAVTAVGIVGIKIKHWLTSQTDQISKELKDQHDCIKKVEANTNILYERSRLAEQAHNRIADEISNIKNQKIELFERLASIEASFKFHIDDVQKKL